MCIRDRCKNCLYIVLIMTHTHKKKEKMRLYSYFTSTSIFPCRRYLCESSELKMPLPRTTEIHPALTSKPFYVHNVSINSAKSYFHLTSRSRIYLLLFSKHNYSL